MAFDYLKCIEILSDKKNDSDIRESAADSLIWACPTVELSELLFQIVCDQTEENEFREEMAICLGSVWGDIGVNNQLLDDLPPQFRAFSITEYELRTKTV